MTDSLDAVDKAIQLHVGEISEGGFAEAWIIVVHSQTLDADGNSGYRIITSDTQPHHVDAGLITVGQQLVQAQFDNALYGDEDDD